MIDEHTRNQVDKYITTYLREGVFFPAELKERPPLVFRLPVLLEELKSASLPAGRSIAALACCQTRYFQYTTIKISVFQ